jgi:hypothetical protein
MVAINSIVTELAELAGCANSCVIFFFNQEASAFSPPTWGVVIFDGVKAIKLCSPPSISPPSSLDLIVLTTPPTSHKI